MTIIYNATQHKATPEQEDAGVINISLNLSELLTFSSLPTRDELWERAHTIAGLLWQYHSDQCEMNYLSPLHEPCRVMIGGAPYLMSPLEEVLKEYSIIPMYAFSERVSEEYVNNQGEVVKRNVFKHLGFVEA